MIALGETVGVVHLERAQPFGDDEVRLAGRTAEQASLALANARLLRTMENLAMTDSLTGLQNTRFFDPLLDHQLTAAARDRASMAVLMVDLDHGTASGGSSARRDLPRTVSATSSTPAEASMTTGVTPRRPRALR